MPSWVALEVCGSTVFRQFMCTHIESAHKDCVHMSGMAKTITTTLWANQTTTKKTPLYVCRLWPSIVEEPLRQRKLRCFYGQLTRTTERERATEWRPFTYTHECAFNCHLCVLQFQSFCARNTARNKNEQNVGFFVPIRHTTIVNGNHISY